MSTMMPELQEPLKRLSRDLAKAATGLTVEQVRYAVDLYYDIQKFRMATANQVRSLSADDEPVSLLSWSFDSMETIEKTILSGLNRYTEAQELGQWAKSICGIGPVITAGLMANIDIHQAPTVGHIWRFAGLDPTKTWNKGEKRPHNGRLKTLCWKIGESFVKFSTNPNDIYGKVYVERKEYEIRRNDGGELADQAAAALLRKRFGEDTLARKHYEAGRLSPGHLHSRAKRYAVKLFLSHYHHVAYEIEFGKAPPKPYIIQHGGHVDFIAPPNWR